MNNGNLWNKSRLNVIRQIKFDPLLSKPGETIVYKADVDGGQIYFQLINTYPTIELTPVPVASFSTDSKEIIEGTRDFVRVERSGDLTFNSVVDVYVITSNSLKTLITVQDIINAPRFSVIFRENTAFRDIDIKSIYENTTNPQQVVTLILRPHTNITIGAGICVITTVILPTTNKVQYSGFCPTIVYDTIEFEPTLGSSTAGYCSQEVSYPFTFTPSLKSSEAGFCTPSLDSSIDFNPIPEASSIGFCPILTSNSITYDLIPKSQASGFCPHLYSNNILFTSELKSTPSGFCAQEIEYGFTYTPELKSSSAGYCNINPSSTIGFVSVNKASNSGFCPNVVSYDFIDPNGTPFDPTIIPANIVLDASTSSNIVFGTGSSVATWNNTSTVISGYHATQSTSAANRPVWVSNVVNGRGAVSFNGTSHFMSFASNISGSWINRTNAYTIFIVLNYDNSGFTGTPAPIFGSFPASSVAGSRISIGSSLTFEIQANNTTIPVQYSYTLDGSFFNTWNILAFAGYNFNAPANSKMRINGLEVAFNPSNSTAKFGWASANYGPALVVGGANSAFFKGMIAEIVFLPRLMSLHGIELFEGYLAKKYDLRSKLPALHPYKSADPVINSNTVYYASEATVNI
jgi:hypothetical protein